MAGIIFISYRRDDSKHAAGRLVDRLQGEFGDDQLFLDVDNIELGLDFVEVINERVAACDVMLVIIGPHWLTAVGRDGARRLDDPNDFVRLEVQAALDRNIRVIPLLVDGAEPVRADQLPDSLARLANRQFTRLAHESFMDDSGRLTRALARIIESSGVQKHVEPDSIAAPEADAPERVRAMAPVEEVAANAPKTQQHDDGGIYEGSFRAGLRHGQGTYTLPNGYKYDGAWVDGEIRGKGVARYPDGSVYEGSFENGAPHGFGKIAFADGGTYEGDWIDGKIGGRGVMLYPNGTRYEGGFRNLQHHGKGVMKDAEGYEYSGGWIDGVQEGHAVITYGNGTIYEGAMKGGVRQGHGKLKTPDGFRYEGAWENGNMSGCGIATYANGDVYEGEFEDGNPCGTGTMRYASGQEASGDWENGALLDDG